MQRFTYLMQQQKGHPDGCPFHTIRIVQLNFDGELDYIDSLKIW